MLRAFVPAILVLGLFAAGCGGDGAEPAPTATGSAGTSDRDVSRRISALLTIAL